MRKLFRGLAAALLLGLLALPAWAGDAVGVLVMHGKHGSPDRGIVSLAEKLEAAGYIVMRPEMPWSGRRDFDKSYPDAIAEMEEDIAKLKARGAVKIVLIGHSLGANAVLAYASLGKPTDALVLLAPGHNPSAKSIRAATAESVAKAKQMVADGQGDSYAHFDDINQGHTITINTTAVIYLSYMDPQGLPIMSETAARIPRPLPTLLAVGDRDPYFPYAKAYVFDRLPAHPASRYLEISADHFGTPDAAAGQVVAWLKELFN